MTDEKKNTARSVSIPTIVCSPDAKAAFNHQCDLMVDKGIWNRARVKQDMVEHIGRYGFGSTDVCKHPNTHIIWDYDDEKFYKRCLDCPLWEETEGPKEE